MLTICGWLRISRSAMSGVPPDEPVKQGDSARQPENDDGQIDHRPPPVTRFGVILARLTYADNRNSITVASQGRLAPTRDEQLCYCERKADAQQDESELYHALTSPTIGVRAGQRLRPSGVC
jgi:hypothetical protein